MKRKKFGRAEAAPKSAAESFVQAAADRVGPLVHDAADRVGPLAHSAADRVGPLAHTVADRINAAAVLVSPYASSATHRIVPLTHAAAERVSPLAHQAVFLVTPYAQLAADRVAPLAKTAKQRGAQAAQEAVLILSPKLDDALGRVAPVVEAAREKVSEDLLPKLNEALSTAAAAPLVAEATKRGKATVAAARGELVLPEAKSKGRWIKRVAIVAAVSGVVAISVKKFLGGKDADWQAARPTTPYAVTQPTTAPPSTQAETTTPTTSEDSLPSGDEPAADATDSSADTSAAEPVAVADLGEPPAETVDSAALVTEEVADEADGSSARRAQPGPDQEDLPAGGEPRYAGEGVYVGSEPPEGFLIKGNERSMKYHLPESRAYSETQAEVWFSTEEAAQNAGFVRAKG